MLSHSQLVQRKHDYLVRLPQCQLFEISIDFIIENMSFCYLYPVSVGLEILIGLTLSIFPLEALMLFSLSVLFLEN
jgi:hypothetical protein